MILTYVKFWVPGVCRHFEETMVFVLCTLVFIIQIGYVRLECTFCETGHCDGNTCSQCQDGYYDDGTKCSKCYLYCKSCEKGQCYQIVSSYCSSFLSEYENCSVTACSANSVDCSNCPGGFYYNNNRCFRCNHYNCKCTDPLYCDKCLPGFWGPSNHCGNICPSNCTSCQNPTYCTECKTGKFGRNCSFNCFDTCPNGCDIDSGNCDTDCPLNQYRRPDGKCDNCTTRCYSCIDFKNCTECKQPHYWGVACEFDCTGCNSKCFKENGCAEGCDNGYYQNISLVRNSFECIRCPELCSSCTGSDKCLSCKGNSWGSVCQFSCDNCRSCTKDTGCGIFCLPGYYPDAKEEGNECKPCSDKCVTCVESIKCEVCEAGYYVNKTKQCSQCPEMCNENKCDITNGTCTAGCSRGLSGQFCDKACPLNCAECDQFNSSKCVSCESGFYGEICETNCSSMCETQNKSLECKKDNGMCPDGCVVGYWSNTCTESCPEDCLSHRCNQTTGDCLVLLSTTGAQSTTSEEQPVNQRQDGEVNEGGDGIAVPAGAGAGGAVVLIVIIIIAVVILRRRRRDGGKSENVDGLRNDAVNAYSSIDDVQKTKKTESLVAEPDAVILNEYSPVIMTKLSENLSDNLDMPNKKSFKPSKKKRDKQSRKQKDETARKIQEENVETKFVVGDLSSTPENLNVKDNSAKSVNNAAQNIGGLNVQSESNTVVTDESGHNPNFDEGVGIENDVDHLNEGSNNVDEEGNMYYNTVGRRVNVAELAEYVGNKSWEDIMEEFEKLPKGLLKSYSVSQTAKNAAKNRYKFIYPYDESRIVLQDGGNDYVNASYIEGYNRPKEYIAAAGPFRRKDKTETTTDFWRMIWQEKCETVVMLTKCFENTEQKCDQYWPELGEKNVYGKVHVTCVTEDQYADFTVRSFIATQDETALNIRQIHFTAWPDKGVPHDVTCLIECRQKVRSLHRDRTSPIIVHCSAGIGRTGTFIALDILTFMGEATGYVDIFGCLMSLRQQRVNLVQTPDQYDYLHEAVLHALTFDCKTIPAEEFITYYSTIIKKKDGSNQLEQQFQKLTSTLDALSLEEKEAIARNKALTDKNRSGADIPSDDDRVRLSQDIKPGSSDYINAVFLNGFKTCNKFIVAQTPLPTTVVDFLSMISQSDCSCVVMVENPDLEDKQTVGVFWPADNQVIKHGMFQVKCVESFTNENYTMKKLSITRRAGKKEEGKLVNLFIFTNWPSDAAAPKSSDSLLQLIKDVDKASSTDENERPIIVNCMTGATKSCLYCAVSVLIEKMEIEHEVSVVNTLRQIKSRRRSAFPTLEQYKFCHQAVISYLQTFATYSNFELKQDSKKEVAADAVYATVQK